MGIITSVPELVHVLQDNQDNLDLALDKFECNRHLFDMASQSFRINKDVFTVNVTMAKVEEFVKSPDFQLLLNTQVDEDAQKQARGFKMGYEKEIEYLGRYITEQCEVLTQMLKSFISTPGEKLSKQKDALRQVVEESKTFARYDGNTIKLDLVAQAEGILSGLELQDGLMQQIQSATKDKDFAKLENYLARATAAGITEHYGPQMVEAHKAYNDYQKEKSKKAKTSKKGEQAPPSPFYDLQSVIANSCMFVGLNSILPLKTNYKALTPAQTIPTETDKYPGVDTTVPGIENMPNLSYFLDQYILLPLILYDCLQFIRYSFGWTEEGLFRLSGNNETIANALLKYEGQHNTCMSNGGYVASEQGFLRPIYTGPFTDIQPTLLVQLFTSPHDATNVMKRWLRSLNSPIVPFEQYKDWAETVSIPHSVTDTTKIDLENDIKESKKLQKLHSLIDNLPPENRGILMYLCLYLYCVSLNSSVSKMTPENLAIVVAPNILRTKEQSQDQGPSSPGGPLNPQQLMALMKPKNNDLLNESKVVNETIGIVIKYAPVLFAPLKQ